MSVHNFRRTLFALHYRIRKLLFTFFLQNNYQRSNSFTRNGNARGTKNKNNNRSWRIDKLILGCEEDKYKLSKNAV